MQARRASTLALRLVAMLALVGALALLGCPDDDDDTVTIGTQATALGEGNADVLVGPTWSFGRVPAFGTGSTAVVFDDRNTATISSAGDTTSADVGYSSCIFTPGEGSTFPAGSPLAPGAGPVTIELCNLIINGGEFTVGGPSGPCTIRWELGTALSVPVDATCSIDADGNIVVNETVITGSVGVGS